MKLGRDKFEVIQACVMVVLAGILLMLAALGYMKWWHSFNYWLLGAGVLVIIGELVRQAMPVYRRSEPEETIITLLLGLLVICIGASNLYARYGRGVEWVEWLFTLIVIVFAILIIVYSYRLRKRRKPK